jgi:hypothetical protein
METDTQVINRLSAKLRSFEETEPRKVAALEASQDRCQDLQMKIMKVRGELQFITDIIPKGCTLSKEAVYSLTRKLLELSRDIE